MFIIREVCEDELLKTGELWLDFMDYNAKFDDSFSVQDNGPELFSKEMLEKYRSPDNRLAVAEADGQLVGFCFSYISRKPRFFRLDKFGMIGDLYVKRQYRRQGIGRNLVIDAMNFFCKKGVSQIELLVAVKNVEAIRFWESIGFEHLLTWMYKRI